MYTQEAALRPYGNIIFIGGLDDQEVDGKHKPLLYRVDPAGVCVGIRGFAAGHKQQEINDQLVSKKGQFGTTENGVKIGLSMY